MKLFLLMLILSACHLQTNAARNSPHAPLKSKKIPPALLKSKKIPPAVLDSKSTCWFGRYYIHVVNQLPANNPLAVRCYSGDDDLGARPIPVGGEYYFSFCTAVFATKFWCDVTWAPKKLHFLAYDIPHNNLCTNHHCSWILKEDGLYLGRGYNPDPKTYVFAEHWQ